jgi:cysteine desulfurase
MKIYLDNAATTPIAPEVLETMLPYMRDFFGNPSSTHQHGRQVRSVIEKARKTVAELLNTTPAEILFTSGGTEADNSAIYGVTRTFGVQHIITSKIEHHAVLHTAQTLAKRKKAEVHFVELDENGVIDVQNLKELLEKYPKSLVSLMHANNEIGNLISLEEIGQICKHYGAFFHSDTVQTMGHYAHNLKNIPVDYIVGAAHKFHGPKGIGFLYVNQKSKRSPFITGGSQERQMRGGTENVYGIIGLAKALEMAYLEMEAHQSHIKNLKKRMIAKLTTSVEGVNFNGLSDDIEKSLYTVLSVSLPPSDDADMLLFNLDLQGISVSGGSACSSGAEYGSHVLAQLPNTKDRAAVRFSFSKYNTEAEIDYTVERLAELYKRETAKV